MRDTLCTLKWEIWEQFPITKRSSLPENMGQIFVEKIMSETANDYTLEEIERDDFILHYEVAFSRYLNITCFFTNKS